MALLETHNVKRYSSYWQIIITDAEAELDTPDNSTGLYMLHPGPSFKLPFISAFIYMGTFQDGGDITLTAELHDATPTDDLSDYDQVEECSLEVKSGSLRVGDPLPDDEGAITIGFEVNSGVYRVRVCYGNLASIEEYGKGNEDSQETYKVVIWPQSFSAPKIIKKWEHIDKYKG